MDARRTNSRFSLTGRIERRTHNVSELKEAYSNWDSMSSEEKMAAAESTQPESSETVYNVTTDRLHQYFVDNLDSGQTSVEDNLTLNWLGLGINGGVGTSTSDTDLNSRTFEKQATDVADNGKELLVSTFIDSTEGNGNDFDELGLFSGDPANIGNAEVFLANHATFGTVTKDNTKTITFDVTLQFSDV